MHPSIESFASMAGVHVSRETFQRLEHFASLFLKWSASINLASSSTLDDLWRRHIADSARLYQLRPQGLQWIDFGSGGGFPGIVTAILLRESADGWVHLVESNKKKAAFLRVALAETGARGMVHPVRIEAALDDVPRCDAISARALASLSQLLTYAAPWMSDNNPATAFFHKGRDYPLEIDQARRQFDFDLLEHHSPIEPGSVVLEISNLSAKRGRSS